MYDKANKIFLHHYISSSLFKTWQRYKIYLSEKIPLWIIPMKILKQQIEYRYEERWKYKDLIY